MSDKATPAGGQPLGAEHLMPWERAGSDAPVSEDGASKNLFDMLADDPSLGGEAGTDEPDEPQDSDDEPSEDDVAAVEGDDDEPDTEESDEDGEAQDAEPEEPEANYEVIVDGQTMRVTLDELRQGYSRTADYTRKTQAVADVRRQIEAEAEAVRQKREAYGQRLEQVEKALADAVPYTDADLDKLRREDPARYAVAFAEREQYRQEIEKVRGERERVANEQRGEYERQYEEYLTRERQRLQEVLPEWKDESKAQAGKREVAQWMLSQGFTERELQGVTDHRLMLALRKAMLYDQAATKGTKAVQSAKKRGAPVLKPGQPVSRKVAGKKAMRERLERAGKTGRLDDAAAALFHMFPE